MMKLFAVLIALTLTACTALSNPQGAAQSVKIIDLKNQTYQATCSGAVEDWPNCYDRAKQTCPNGYVLKERNQNPVGGKRELVFQCNK
jgi:hypothetical protein